MNGYRARTLHQQGFAGVVFLVIALIAIVMAGIAAMSRNSATGAPEQNAKTNAAVLLKQASDLKVGFDRMLIDGRNAATITFGGNATTDLIGTAAGTTYAVRPVPPVAAVESGVTPAFTYNNSVTLPGVGTVAADAVFTVGNVTLDVCRQINRILYNSASNANPATSAGTLAAWTTAPAAVDDSSQGGETMYNGRPEGCVRASGGEFIYYKAAAEN